MHTALNGIYDCLRELGCTVTPEARYTGAHCVSGDGIPFSIGANGGMVHANLGPWKAISGKSTGTAELSYSDRITVKCSNARRDAVIAADILRRLIVPAKHKELSATMQKRAQQNADYYAGRETAEPMITAILGAPHKHSHGRDNATWSLYHRSEGDNSESFYAAGEVRMSSGNSFTFDRLNLDRQTLLAVLATIEAERKLRA